MNTSKLEPTTFLTPATCFSVACIAFSLLALSTIWRNNGASGQSELRPQAKRRKAVDSIYFGKSEDHNDEQIQERNLVRIGELVSLCTKLLLPSNSKNDLIRDYNNRGEVLNELSLLTTALCRLQQDIMTGRSALERWGGLHACFDTAMASLEATLLSLEELMSCDSSDSIEVSKIEQRLKAQRPVLQFLLDNASTMGLPPTPPFGPDSGSNELILPACETTTGITPSVDEKCWIEPPPEYSPPSGAALALLDRNPDAKRDLSSPKADQGLQDSDALHDAVRADDRASVLQLLSAGFDTGAPLGELQRTPLHLAAHLNHPSCISALLKYGAVMSTEDAKGDTALHLAAWAGNVESLQIMISHGADVDWLSGRDGYSPLWCAISASQIDAARLLLRHGARVSLKAASSTGLTPLHQAAVTGQSAMCELLIERGAQVDSRDDDQNTPLHYASACGSVASVQVLLCAGADIEARQVYGLAPIHWAAHKNHAQVLNVLCDSGAHIDARAEEGATPLHLAASRGHVVAAKLLLERGCSRRPGSASWDGVTGSPAEMAKKRNHNRLVRILRA